jgi:hypothetical protein
MANVQGAAQRFVEQEYGGTFTQRESTVAVGTVRVPAVPTDYNRTTLNITNTGVTNITLARDPGVVSGVGILLLGNGSSIELTARDDGAGVALQWYAVSDLAGGSLFVEETIETVPPAKTEG